MRKPILLALSLLAAVNVGGWFARTTVTAQAPSSNLRIVVIEGEDAVNVVQQKSAVAPVIEVRDRNDQPVAGVLVRFAIRNGRATFNGARAISVTTNAAGRAAAAGLTPTGSGALQISAAASFQGQSAAAVIAQTNVMTAAQAAAATAGASGAGTSAGTGAGAGAAGAGGGTGVSGTTLGVVGGAAAGTVVAVNQLTDSPAITNQLYAGRFSGTESLSFGGAFCRNESLTGTLKLELKVEDGNVTGTANIDDGVITTLSTSAGCSAFNGRPDSFGLVNGAVTGSTSNIGFAHAQTNVVPPNPLDPQGTTNSHEYTFTGSLNGSTISGSIAHRRVIGGVVAGTTTFQVTLQ